MRSAVWLHFDGCPHLFQFVFPTFLMNFKIGGQIIWMRIDCIDRFLPVARGRLQQTVDIQVGKLAGRLNCGDFSETRMHVERDQRVLRQLVAQRSADGIGKVKFLARNEALSGAEGTQLEALKILGENFPGGFEKSSGRALGVTPAI